MDPRHPEQAISRMDELMVQYKKVLDDIRRETVVNRLGEHERQASLVIQEICLVAPRLHEAMMVVSRSRRGAMAAGFVESVLTENYVAPNQAETIIVEPRPKKKKTSKKKKED